MWCFYNFYANTDLYEKLGCKNFRVIFPGCGLECKKGNSKFPFFQNILYLLAVGCLKGIIKLINSIFFSMYALLPSYRCCLHNFSKARPKCYIAMLLVSLVSVKNSTLALKSNYSVQDCCQRFYHCQLTDLESV